MGFPAVMWIRPRLDVIVTSWTDQIARIRSKGGVYHNGVYYIIISVFIIVLTWVNSLRYLGVPEAASKELSFVPGLTHTDVLIHSRCWSILFIVMLNVIHI